MGAICDRNSSIRDLASEQHGSELIDIDHDAVISEGDSNGCYVQAWLWVTFSCTEFDKDEDL